MYHVPHHACHPSRMGDLSKISNGKAPNNNIGCGCLTVIILLIFVIGVFSHCGNQYSSSYNGTVNSSSNNYQVCSTSSDTTSLTVDSAPYTVVGDSSNKRSNNENSYLETSPNSSSKSPVLSSSKSYSNNSSQSSTNNSSTRHKSYRSHSYSSKRTTSNLNDKNKTEYVHGYHRKDGTYVRSYHRRPRR